MQENSASGQLMQELEAARFLAQAGAALAEIVDYQGTLERIANLAVPAFSDWFGVHIREPGREVRRIAVRHQDEAKREAVAEMYRRYPPSQGDLYGAPRVLATGEVLWAPEFEALIPETARDAEHARMLRALGLRSFVCVPMRSRGVVMGALTFATAESGRTYGEVHRRAAEDLALRAAIAIENAQLVEALREADRRKDEFLAMLAHELRNPLAPIRNAAHILAAKAALVPELQPLNGVIERQVRQLSRLVDDLLDVSRITRGRIELRRERTTLAVVVEGAVEWSRPQLEAGRHALEVRLPDVPVEIDADPVRLTQVVANLLNNAAKYSDPGAPVAIDAEVADGRTILRVTDHGNGIPPEMLDKVFDMFVQAHRPADSKGGLGIGLTLVRRLVELHGGSVTAHSDGVGKGSRFEVTLPLATHAAPAAQPAKRADVGVS